MKTKAKSSLTSPSKSGKGHKGKGKGASASSGGGDNSGGSAMDLGDVPLSFPDFADAKDHEQWVPRYHAGETAFTSFSCQIRLSSGVSYKKYTV